MIKTCLLAAACLLVAGGNADGVTLDAGPFAVGRAAGDGLATDELQRLIDKAARRGGGVVVFPAGEYRTGALRLRSRVCLRLEHGSVVVGSDKLEDYRDLPSLIYAKGEVDCRIEGSGVLDGQGEAFWKGKKRPFRRPERFVLFERCKNVRIEGIRIEDSPHWTIETRFCDGVWIDRVSIVNSLDSPNTDGIDPVSCQNVFITNCYISTGDDAICPKSLSPVPCENVVVTNCILESDDSAIKLGTRSEAPIRHMTVSNCVIRNSAYGIAMFAKDGGAFEHLRFSNITIETARQKRPEHTDSRDTYPLFLDVERRGESAIMGAIRDVHFEGITIDTDDGQCAFLGQPDRPIENLRLTNVSFTLNHRRSRKDNRKPRGVRNLKDLAANDCTSEPSSFVFAHVDGLVVDQMRIADRAAGVQHGRHGIWTKDVANCSVVSLQHLVTSPDHQFVKMFDAD